MDTASSLTNSGTITGGNGGGGGNAITVNGNDVIINSGTIIGGASSNGQTQAIYFKGGGNTLELYSTSKIIGSVFSDSSNSNGGDTLELGGETNGTFNLSNIGGWYQIGYQYEGFTNYVKTDASTWTLTGSTSVSTRWAINGGTLAVNSVGSIGAVTLTGTSPSAPSIFQYSGATANLGQTITVSTGSYGVVQNSGGGVLTLSGTVSKNGGVLILAGGQFVVTGTITGSAPNSDLDLGSTTYGGAATVGLTSANSYNGPTVITAGSTLLTGVDGALPTTIPSDVTLGASTDTAGQTNTLDLLGTNQTVNSLTSTGSGTNQIISSNGTASGTPAIGTGASTATASLTVNYSGGTTNTFSGLLGDSNGTRAANNFSLTKSGTGTLALTGTNSYTGGTTVTAGTLLANGSHSTGSGAVNVTSGGSLGGSGTISTSGVLSGNAVTVASGATLDQSIVSDGLGTSTLTLDLHNSGTTTTTVDLLQGAKFAFDLGASGISDQVVVTGGTLTLNNQGFADFSFTTVSGFTGAGTYDLMVTDGSGDLLGSLSSFTGFIGGHTATLSLVNSQDLVLTVDAAPEPSTWVLILGGLGLLAVWRQRICPGKQKS